MKREELRKIDGISDEQIDAIMQLHQNDVSSWNSRIDGLKDDLSKRDETIKELTTKVSQFDGIDVAKLQQDVKDWETKYNDDMASKDKDFAKKLFFNSINFSSNYAKDGIIADFEKHNFEFKDGEFVGAKEYIEKLKESDPNAFVIDNDDNHHNGSTGMHHGDNPNDDDLDGVTKRFLELNEGLKI